MLAMTQAKEWHDVIASGRYCMHACKSARVDAFRGRGGVGSRADEAGPFLPASAAAGRLTSCMALTCSRQFHTLQNVHPSGSAHPCALHPCRGPVPRQCQCYVCTFASHWGDHQGLLT